MALPSDILSRSPEAATRFVALELLSEIRAAAERLEDREDVEGLHAFRVAVRRLRSTARAWSEELAPSVRKRHRRALRSLQTATGGSRDAEVALAWLAAQRQELGRGQKRGHAWLVGRLEQEREEAMARVREETRRAFESIDRELAPRLGRITIELQPLLPERRTRFGEVLAGKALAQVGELARSLGEVSSADDEERCHAARIACKRLRYLVEPVQAQLETAALVVKRCKRLQDLLGDLNDAHVLLREIAVALDEATRQEAQQLFELAREQDPRLARARRRAVRPGLLELARRVQRRIRLHFEELEKHWPDKEIRQLADGVQVLAEQLAALRPGLHSI